MRGRLLVLVLLCHRVDGLLLTTSPAARLPAPVGGDSPLVRPLEGPDFFDACSTAHVAVVLFHGEKCRSCRAFTPKYSRLAQQYQGQAEFFRVVATRNADLLASEHVATLLPCVNVYVGGCCVRRLSASDGESSIGQLQEELSRSLDPLVLDAKLAEEGCEAPALADAGEDAPATTFLALLCSFGMLARGAAMFDSLEVAALWDSLEITTLS